MALIPCYECEKEISDKAPACPHCGAPAGGKKDGVYKTYDENDAGWGERKQTYKDGVGHGPYELYHESGGQLYLKGTYNMDEKCGEWFEDGKTVTYDPCPPGLADGN